MLIGDVNPNVGGQSERHATLQMLLDTLALTHVSRYPVEVVSVTFDSVLLRDSRFPKVALLRLSLDESTGKITVYSDRISNYKFKETSPEFRTRTTNDVAKVRKWLKEYTQPFTPAEVAKLSSGQCRDEFSSWASEFNEAWRMAYASINRTDIMEDIIRYLGGAQPYSTGTLAGIATSEFRTKMLERNRRQNVPHPPVNLFINSDGVCWLTFVENVQYSTCVPKDTKITDSIDALPLPVREKYSMLKLVEDSTYVESVGLRLSHNNFWLHE